MNDRFSLRARYEEFKQRRLFIQALRLVNMMLASFTFWNIVIQPDPLRGLYGTEIAVLYSALPLGSVLGFLLLVLFRDYVQVLLLPFLALGFIVSSTTGYRTALIAIPIWSFLLLIVTKLVILIAAFFSVSKK